MICARTYHDSNVAVLGLGRTGLSAARALAAGGARVRAWDDAQPARAQLAELGDANIVLADPAAIDWREISALVVSPGIPVTYPAPHHAVECARDAGCEIVGDIELFARARQAQFPATGLVLVTGTNGKSTTTALIGCVLSQAGRSVQVGGNIGTGVLDLEPLDGDGVFVVEVSSYQLELTQSPRATAAILLNITPDHLDRHGGMAGYVAAKQRVFEGMSPDGAAIVGIDDPYGVEICDSLRARGDRVIPISVESEPAGGVFAREGRLYDALAGEPREVMDLHALASLPGVHNWQNAAAAYAAAKTLGLSERAIVEGIESFPGLAHRMEAVGRRGTVAFVNDSKATNAEAAARALACYEQVHVILGGVAKAGGIASLAPLFPRIRKAYLIGEAAPEFSATLQGIVAHEMCGDLASAVSAAYADARKAGEQAVVLLSPACASFDQFEDFEARGAAFHRAVEALQEVSA